MIAVLEKVQVEAAKLKAILDRRGIFFEDEKARYQAMLDVAEWIAFDKSENERIESEALAAAEAAEEAERRADPNFKNRELFKNVKINVPRKETR